MSADELDYHKSLVAYKAIACSTSARDVEMRIDTEIEGLLLILGRSAWFEWYANDNRAFGKVAFEAKSGDLDRTMVRAICSSLFFDGTVYPENPDGQMLESIRDELQIESHAAQQRTAAESGIHAASP